MTTPQPPKSEAQKEPKTLQEFADSETAYMQEWIIKGGKWIVEQAENMATRPLPESLTRYEPFLEVRHLKNLLEPK